MTSPIRYGLSLRFLGADPTSGRGEWLLLEHTRLFEQVVPHGFKTDGGSIPLWLAWFLNPTGRGFPAFVLHDWRYTDHRTTRAAADGDLRRHMRALGCGRFHAFSAFAAVRIFGGSHWANKPLSEN